MPHKRNHGNNRINRLINQFITNVPELRVPTPEDIEDAIVVLKEVVGNLDFYYGFVDEEWQEVINVDTARELLYQYLNEYLLLGDNPGIPSENAGDRDDCGECIDYNPDDPQAPEENQYTPGDPNKDGNIDILDVILLVHVIITGGTVRPGGGNGRTVCFLPEQLINMGDGSKKPIIDIKENDFVKVFDTETNQVKISKVNKIVSLENDDVYELHLSNNKIV